MRFDLEQSDLSVSIYRFYAMHIYTYFLLEIKACIFTPILNRFFNDVRVVEVSYFSELNKFSVALKAGQIYALLHNNTYIVVITTPKQPHIPLQQTAISNA